MITQRPANVRLAVWGAGVMGRRVAAAASELPGVEVVAIIDRDLARALEAAREVGALAAVSFEQARQGVEFDAVYIGLPNAAHRDACIAAAEHGVSVLADKPLTVDLDQADEVLAAAAASSGFWMMGFSFRFRGEWRRAREIIRSGEIGTPYFISDNVIEAYRRTPDWYWRQDAGGGTLNLQSHHVFDRWEWLLGASVTSLCVQTLLPESLANNADADLVAAMLARFGDQVLGSSAMSFGLRYDAQHRIALTVQGTEGMVEIDEGRRITVSTADGVWSEIIDDDWLAVQVEDFVAGVRGVDRGQPSLLEGRRAVRLADAARLSAARGTWVDVIAAFPAAAKGEGND